MRLGKGHEHEQTKRVPADGGGGKVKGKPNSVRTLWEAEEEGQDDDEEEEEGEQGEEGGDMGVGVDAVDDKERIVAFIRRMAVNVR